MRGMIFALAALAALPLAGCGFSPLYAPTPGGAPVIGAVDIPMIPGKSGHVLRNELDRILGVEREAGPAQRLDITLLERVQRLGLRRDESSSRADLLLTAHYVLTPAGGGRPVRGTVRSTATFTIPLAAFGEIAAQDDARERAAETLAQRIRADIAIRLAHARRQRGA